MAKRFAIAWTQEFGTLFHSLSHHRWPCPVILAASIEFMSLGDLVRDFTETVVQLDLPFP